MAVGVVIYAIDRGDAISKNMMQSEDAKKRMAHAEIRNIRTALELYRIDHEEYPQSLKELYERGERGGPYLKDPGDIISPWDDKPYTYEPQGDGMPIISVKAPDGTIISNEDDRHPFP